MNEHTVVEGQYDERQYGASFVVSFNSYVHTVQYLYAYMCARMICHRYDSMICPLHISMVFSLQERRRAVIEV